MSLKKGLVRVGVGAMQKMPWASKKGLEIIIRKTAEKSSSNLLVQKDAYDLYNSMKNALINILSDTNIAPAQKRTFRSFIENTMSGEIRAEIAEKVGRDPAVFSTISPTRRCNKKCVGCYASQETAQMTKEQFDLIVTKGKEDMGWYFRTISGGEPLSLAFRRIFFEVAAKHPDVLFNTYTNGTFIDREVAKELAKLGNILPAISIEGDKAATDARRGVGSHEEVMTAMQYLNEYRVAFGNSFTHTSKNVQSFNLEFFRDLQKKGSRFCWEFEYLCIDPDADLGLFVPIDVKEEAFYKLRNEIRPAMPDYFIGSFWKDGRQVQGCMAGGKVYVHESVFADPETKENVISLDPCVFIPFTTASHLDERLRKGEKYYEIIYNDPLCKAVREWQKNYDLYDAPCLTRCNIRELKKIVEETGAVLSRSQPIPLLEGEIFEGLAKYGDEWRARATNIAKERYGIECKCV